MKITDKINSYEDVCVIDGVDPVKSLPFPETKNAEENAVNNVAKCFRIARVLNEGWQPDWNNDDERKYYPWFDMETYPDQVGSGVGFSFVVYGCVGSCSAVGARLVFKTSELANFAGTKFLDVYHGYMVIEK